MDRTRSGARVHWTEERAQKLVGVISVDVMDKEMLGAGGTREKS